MDQAPETQTETSKVEALAASAVQRVAVQASKASHETGTKTRAEEPLPFFSFYLCDDALPVFSGGMLKNEDLINDSAIRNILKDAGYTWNEPEVRDLLEAVVAHDRWNILAARNPELLIRHFENSLDKPDVLVFDWDYAGLAKPTEDYLLEFLEQTFCLVRIYTGVDKVEEIKAVLKTEKFLPFESRLSIAEKSKVAADTLLADVQAQYKSNFSYQFGSRLRRSTLGSLEEILVALGKLPLDDVMALLNTSSTKETDFKEIIIEKFRNHLTEDDELQKYLESRRIEAEEAKTLINIISEKLRNNLNQSDVQLVPQNPGGVDKSDPKMQKTAADLWAYRLYHQPSDSAVRRGDLILHEKTGKYFVVVNADCDLNRFWAKNYGYLNLVPAYVLAKGSQDLKDRFKSAGLDTAKYQDSYFSPKAFTGELNKLQKGIMLLPFVQIDGKDHEFLVFPKEITSVFFPPPSKPAEVSISSLRYDPAYGYKRICTVSEPFLTPFIATLLEALAGLGVPDFTEPAKAAMRQRCKTALTQ